MGISPVDYRVCVIKHASMIRRIWTKNPTNLGDIFIQVFMMDRHNLYHQMLLRCNDGKSGNSPIMCPSSVVQRLDDSPTSDTHGGMTKLLVDFQILETRLNFSSNFVTSAIQTLEPVGSSSRQSGNRS